MIASSTSTDSPSAYTARRTSGKTAGLGIRVRAHPRDPPRLRRDDGLEPGRQDLEPRPLDLELFRGRARPELGQLDPQLGDFPRLEEARLHVQMT